MEPRHELNCYFICTKTNVSISCRWSLRQDHLPIPINIYLSMKQLHFLDRKFLYGSNGSLSAQLTLNICLAIQTKVTS